MLCYLPPDRINPIQNDPLLALKVSQQALHLISPSASVAETLHQVKQKHDTTPYKHSALDMPAQIHARRRNRRNGSHYHHRTPSARSGGGRIEDEQANDAFFDSRAITVETLRLLEAGNIFSDGTPRTLEQTDIYHLSNLSNNILYGIGIALITLLIVYPQSVIPLCLLGLLLSHLPTSMGQYALAITVLGLVTTNTKVQIVLLSVMIWWLRGLDWEYVSDRLWMELALNLGDLKLWCLRESWLFKK